MYKLDNNNRLLYSVMYNMEIYYILSSNKGIFV